MPRLMELLGEEAEGNDIMAAAPAIVEADRVRREEAAKARRDAALAEEFASNGVTEANPTYGMF